jgi:hypothetical protein
VSRPDDDRALEHLLKAMRGAMPDEPAGITPACVDAERLAAWSEGGLPPAERASIEAHVSSCARCLAMLAVFSETASSAHAASVPHGGSVPAHEVGLTPRLQRWWRSPTRWLVPITTAAAAVLIWMVLPARPPAPAFAPTTQVARDEAAPTAPAPQGFDGRSADQARESAASQAAPPPAPRRAVREQSNAAGPAEETERRTPNIDSIGEVVAQEPAAKAQEAAARQRAANESVSDRAAAAGAPSPAGPAAPSPPAATAPAAALLRAESVTIEIHSPDPARRWRIRGTVVERSVTGGSSWQPAVIPSGATVTAGTSPSPNVCWLVGPNGTVLRTTDGSRFETVTISGAGALISIQAADANQATATASNGTTFTTTDGGRNWTR